MSSGTTPCQFEYFGSNHFYRSLFSVFCSCSPNALTSTAEGAVLSTLSTGIALGTCGQLLLICPVDLQSPQACLSCLGSVYAVGPLVSDSLLKLAQYSTCSIDYWLLYVLYVWLLVCDVDVERSV